MEKSATPEFMLGQMRVLTMAGITFFYVTNQPTPMTELDKDLEAMMLDLEAAKVEANIARLGPIIIRFYKANPDAHTGGPDLYVMEAGVPVQPGMLPAGKALVKTLPPYHCAALLHWGSLEHIGESYGALTKAIQEAGLEQTGEGREWHYHFEGDNSPNNVIGLYMEVR